MNRFRYQETNPVEQEKWIDSEGDWVVSSEPRKEWIYSYIYLWIDSVYVRDFCETIHT